MTLVYHFRGINLSHLSSWPVLYVSLAYRSVSLEFPAFLDPSCASIFFFPISLRIRVEKCNAARLRWIEGVESLAEDLAIKKSSIGSRRMGREEGEREENAWKVCERDAAGHEAANHSAAIANKKFLTFVLVQEYRI